MTKKTDITPGGVRELIAISLPIIVSQASESLMLFTDRLLLTPLGKAYPAASMAGGFTAMIASIFFIGVLTYTTPLVAQFLGAGQEKNCSLVATQGWCFALLQYPFVALLGYWFAPYYFDFVGTPIEEKLLALQYFNVFNFTEIVFLFNVVFAGFFSGIGKTRYVMFVNFLGMLVNIPISYYLIHFGIGGYFVGIQGAAIGTSLSQLLMNLMYGFLYLRPDLVERYGIKTSFRFSKDVFDKVVRFGLPTGVEFFLIFFAFNSFVNLFHSYGSNDALAITITFNWNILAFMPIWGLSIGIMSLAGRFLGAREIESAQRTAFSGLKIATFLTVFFGLLFLFFTEPLIRVFIPENIGDDLPEVMAMATFMLHTVSLYIFADALNLIFSSTLRAAGDTKFCMWGSIASNWTMLVLTFCGIRYWGLSPKIVWLMFVANLFALALIFGWRFFQGRWKTIVMVS